MSEPPVDLRVRTKQFALRVIRLSRALPSNVEGRVIAQQVIRSGTSAGANYRGATRARSNAEFISKLGQVLQELDETIYWCELAEEAELVAPIRLDGLRNEADQLIAIMTTMCKRAGSKPRRSL